MRSVLRVLFAMAGWFIVVTVLWTGLLGLVDPPVTWIMLQQSFEQDHIQRRSVDLDKISRNLPLSVIASEDQRFMTHYGFSLAAMRKAMDRNKKSKRVRGGSTISQQTAKNVFLWPSRNYLRKGMEVWFTVLIETLWTKERILEVYLNVAEMGKGVFGAEAAARHCFGASASKLSAAQCALITATLPAPRRFNCARPSGYVLGRQQWVLRQMRNVGDVLDPEVLARRKEKLERDDERREAREARKAKKKR